MSLDRTNTVREFRPQRGPGLQRVNPENLDDVLALYKLREELEQEPPPFSVHANWVSGRPYLAWYLILGTAGLVVGSVYLTRQREVGVSVFRDHQRHGHGGAAVREMMQKHSNSGEPFRAIINHADEVGRKFWESVGFTLSQHIYERTHS